MSKRILTGLLVVSMLLTVACQGDAGKDKKDGTSQAQTEPKNADGTAGDQKTQVNAKAYDGLLKGANLKNIDIPYVLLDIKPNVPGYSVKNDLSDVLNVDLMENLNAKDKQVLAKQLFVMKPLKKEKDQMNQLFQIYEENDYRDIPSFISADAMMHSFHVFYDGLLRKLEQEFFLPKLEELSARMLEKVMELSKEAKDPKVKEAFKNNEIYFGLMLKLLGKTLPADLSGEVVSVINDEFDLVEKQEGFFDSALINKKIDYSQFTPRGHYTRSEDLTRYFKTMMYMGLLPFELRDPLNNNEPNEPMTLTAMGMTFAIFSEEDTYNNWLDIYETTSFFVGNSDDLGIHEYGKILFDVYGKDVSINDLTEEEKFNQFVSEVDKLEDPRIQAKYTEVTTPTGKQFRFMGQRFVMDAEIIQKVVEPILRGIPSGLDVMAAFGSEEAKNIQLEKEENQNWEDYPVELEKVTQDVAAMQDSEWMENMYSGWMWSIKAYLNTYEVGYPEFMKRPEWKLKSLNSALASWAEAKHDTILYGKQSGAELGGSGEIPPPPKGYVEPNIELYTKLRWLLEFSKENLKMRAMISEAIEGKIDFMIEKLEFLITVSEKELKNEALTEEEYYRIKYFGGALEWMILSAAEVNYWDEITSETDKNMALIADFHTVAPNQFDPGGYLEAAVGDPQEIYVIVPIDGKPALTRGAVFSFYEFLARDKRYTDEEWQKMLIDGTEPEILDWQKTFYASEK